MKIKFPHKGPYGTISVEECHEVANYDARKYICSQGEAEGYSPCGDCIVIDDVHYCQREWLKPRYMSWGSYYRCDFTKLSSIAEQISFFKEN